MAALNIGIAGCGPAGLAAAILLAREGHKVTLFERFDTPKPVGSGFILQPTGLAALEEIGVSERLEHYGARLSKLVGHSMPHNRCVLDVRYSDLPGNAFGLSIHRAGLFRALFEGLDTSRIAIQTKCEIVVADVESNRASFVDTRGTRHGPFDICIDALGTQSPLRVNRGGTVSMLTYGALWANLPWPQARFDASALQQRYKKASSMVGVMPIGKIPDQGDRNHAAFFWSLRQQDYDDWKRKGLNAWKDEVLGIWPETEPMLAHISDPDQLVMARYGHTSFKNPVKDRLVAIGDAAHATSPQLGQGANMALLDAAALARSLTARANVSDALHSYARTRYLNRRAYQAISYAFTPFYQSDGTLLPLMRDRVLGPITRISPIPQILARLVSGSLVPVELGADRKL